MATERIKGVASLGHAKITWADAKATLLDLRIYLHHAVCIAFSVAFSSISLFTPTIVSGLGYQGLAAQLFTVPPYAIAFAVTVFVAWQSDKRRMRSWGAFSCLMISGTSFVVQGQSVSQYDLIHQLNEIQVLCLPMLSRQDMPCSAWQFRFPLQ